MSAHHAKDSGQFFFILNPKYILTHKKYRRHLNFNDAMAEAIRLSTKQPEDQFFVYESSMLGCVVNGKPTA